MTATITTFTDLLQDNLNNVGPSAVPTYNQHVRQFLAGPLAEEIFEDLCTDELTRVRVHEAAHAIAYFNEHPGDEPQSIACFVDDRGRSQGGICGRFQDADSAREAHFRMQAAERGDWERAIEYGAVLQAAGYPDPIPGAVVYLKVVLPRYRRAVEALVRLVRESGYLPPASVRDAIAQALAGGAA